jgi:hypothetical protein
MANNRKSASARFGNGHKTETGKPFYTSRVHSILTHEGYTGRASFNRTNSRTGAKRPRDEWVTVNVPAIIPEATFRRVQTLLKARRPDRTPPRITSSRVLLTGIAVCECCGKPLMMATGKRNQYRYYKCAGRLLAGAVCGGNPPSQFRRSSNDTDRATSASCRSRRRRCAARTSRWGSRAAYRV